MNNLNSSLEAKLLSAIEQKLSTVPQHKVQGAFAKLSEAYRSHQAFKVTGASEELFVAYIAGRMPATFAVVSRVLGEYLQIGGQAPSSLLDIGAGPATASFAALSIFENLSQLTLIERERSFRDIALGLARAAEVKQVTEAKWMIGTVAANPDLPKADIAIASYSLGEMPLELAKSVALGAFKSSVLAFVIIEPGTPQGFARVRDLREHLLSQGASIAAPCPHQLACPMTGTDFCHFSQRLHRESFHRVSKGAQLAYEDEKFSYAIFTKQKCDPYFGRLVRRPIKSTGHVTLDICKDGQLVRKVIARSNKALYKTARKSEWGDRFLGE